MLFNSVQFAVFFVVVYGLYLTLDHKWQNRMLLVASYIFYGAWDWRFLSLILLSTSVDFICGSKIRESQDNKRRKLFLIISAVINLSILGFFKYFNFFASSLQILLSHFGFNINAGLLHIVLPVGISFYTFQSMSYTIDVYRREIEPAKKFRDFALFVSFFPQLVAGPIERAKHLLPQIISPRKLSLDEFYEGCYLIFWGLFQKVFIADNLARIANPIFASSAPYKASEIIIALYAFAFQIFCDFAGYSNIARGLGKCMGFDIMVNFNLPYFATNPREFWKRWHISLSTWLRDYLYIPLGGSKKGVFRIYRNLFLTMLLGGLWHGASWTFVLWGAYQGTLLIIHRLLEPLLIKIPTPKNALIKKTWFFIRIIFFFHLICFGWLIFRAQSLLQVSYMLKSFTVDFNFHSIALIAREAFKPLFYLWLLLIVQLLQWHNGDLLITLKSRTYLRAIFYVICYFLLITYGLWDEKEFIYFQF